LEQAHCIVEALYRESGNEYTPRIFVSTWTRIAGEQWQQRLFGPFYTKQQALVCLGVAEEPKPTRKRATTGARKARVASAA
jgi:hypothetical protein